MKKLFATLCLILPVLCTIGQCYGPTTTGVYTSGKQPSANSSYFSNHVFSTYSSTASGSLNGNSFSITTSGTPTSNSVANTTPGEAIVTGSSFPSSTPSMQSVSTNSTLIKVTHTFTSTLQAGTHVYLQDIDVQEGWSIVFKDASGSVINPSSFIPFNASTTNLPATYTASAVSLTIKSTSNVNASEPLVAIIITSSSVKSIEFSVSTIGTSSSLTGIFYSYPQLPSLTLTSNQPVNYGSTLNLTSTISNGSAPYTYTWSGPNSFSSSTANPAISNASSANAGIYSLSITDNNGCSASATTYVTVKSAWIYIHDKNINEESSVNFTFKVKDTSGSTINTFITNDSAGNTFNVYDLGAGHDDGAGTLWVVAGSSIGTTNTGTVYKRAAGSSTWAATNVTNATAVDGAGSDQFVYVTNNGNAYIYKAGVSTLIFDHSVSHSSQTANASDIAYGGGKIALRNANGRVYLYTGNYTNDSWTDISANTNIADRIDLSSDGSMIVYIKSATVKEYIIASATTTTLPAFTTVSGAGAASIPDIAIDDNGTIYGLGTTGNTTCCGNTTIVFSYATGASAWTSEPEGRGIVRLTGGVAGEAWGGVNLGTTFPQTIYTRVTDNSGTHIWLDDERVKNSSSLYSNSILMEYNAGTYKINPTLPDTTWDVSRFNIYDPTGNTSGNSTTNVTTINVAYGEVVNVEFIAEKLNPKVMYNGNCNTSILQSFDAGSSASQFGNSTFGTPVEGTAYHYFAQTSPQDGYYYLAKTTDGNWFTTPGVNDHTGNGGYFMLVNASYAKDEFYRQRITGLTQNLTYRIQFYVANVLPTNPIRPKIRFGMQTLSGTIFGDSTTAEITSSAWQLCSVSFTVPSGVSTADLFLRNENIGGLGNDLAIDDIAINPIPTPLSQNTLSSPSLCIGSTYTLSNTVSGGVWTISDPTVATIDQPTSSITILKAGTTNITYTYTNNIYCVSTATSSINVTALPVAAAASSGGSVCNNGTIALNASVTSGTAPYSYSWTASAGSLSSATVANPTLTAPSTAGNYSYSVTVTDSSGCASLPSATSVTVRAAKALIYPYCVESGSSPYASLKEIGGSTGATWLWSSSSSDALFYTAPGAAPATGTATSTLQNPYVNYSSQYKVIVTDTYGCKDSSTIFFTKSICSILSVSLINFNAERNNDIIHLTWATASETNSKYFIIERSNDEKNWSEVGVVNAAGTSNALINYSFNDPMPLAGINYYRLKQVDNDSKYYVSSVRSVLAASTWKVNIYPNPVKGGLLKLQSNNTLSTIQITDTYGKVLLQRKSSDINNADLINISNYKAGLYFIQVTNDKGQVIRSSFIKQ